MGRVNHVSRFRFNSAVCDAYYPFLVLRQVYWGGMDALVSAIVIIAIDLEDPGL